MGKKTKMFRVAVEGGTTDGRAITKRDLLDIASSYDPTLYGARVDLEHIKSYSPESVFRAYGDVLAPLKTEVIADGPLKGKLALYAQIDATDDLVALNKKRQKVYPSIQFHPQFEQTGGAYLMGLALTDTPASLGTEMLEFCAQAKTNPLASRKKSAECLIAAVDETMEFSIELEDVEPPADTGMQFFNKIKNILTGSQQRTAGDIGQIQQAVEQIALSQKELLDGQARLSAIETENATLKQSVAKLTTDFSTLTESLSSQPEPGKKRQPATGSDTEGDQSELADC
ncbi:MULTISPECIES: GPO family capsid scaffolding protein [unclassified Serratia (in: enterobacteria)]|uniref:GPO family capsid scaffolding protein n=1 Tax=unclassified Serratia (in: enterobacteria) TaxID=2647522 RepID=UPI00307662FD